MRTIIIDDEQGSHQVLKKLIEHNHSDVEVVASAYSVSEGIDSINQHQPDLVFLDIELPDGHGFDILKQFPNPEFLVIFITAHDQYAITAIRFGALDFLLKLIDPEELAIALDNARKKIMRRATEKQLQLLLETMEKLAEKKLPTRMSIATASGILFIELQRIIRLEAQANYTEFILADTAKKLITSKNIGHYVDQFELYEQFIPVHRSHVVNMHHVVQYVKSDGGYLIMSNGDKVPVSRKGRGGLDGGLEAI